MNTAKIITLITALVFFMLVCMPWLARAEDSLSESDWPFTFPALCPQDPGDDLIMMTLEEIRTVGTHEYLYTWTRVTNCQTVSPISKMEVVMLPEPGPAVSLMSGALGVYTLRRMRS